MLISKEWLSEFVDLGTRSDEKIAQEFSLRTAEVEGVVSEATALEKICIGEIIEVAPHPNADRLRVTKVDVGEHVPLSIVCGGTNLAVGMKVVIARVGSRVQWHGAGELVTLEPAEIRGVKSDGMICGADEIGLAAEFPKGGEKEILDLSAITAKPGTPLAIALGKNHVLFEIDNKSLSNRPDLWGMRGMAREFGAVLGAKVTLPAAKKITGKNDFALDVKIEDSKLCTRYQAVVIDGVSAGVQSPTWMQARLNAAGVRPINAIVDVTNYVMLEGAQPLHAFDFDAVKDKENHATIFVRGARGGETLATLDGQKHELPTGALVIATKKDVIGIAGIMGGVHHSIGAATKTIVIESAHFAASSIRQTSMKMHLRTESSSRFEKGLDVYNTEWGIARAVELLKEIFPKARVASSVIDEKTALAKTRVLDLSAEDLQRAIGGDVELSRAKKILESLGFDCVATAKKLRVTIPTFRMKDIVGTHDLIEEIVRLFGFENITSLLPAVQLRSLEEDRVSALRYSVKELCALRHGFTEVNTYGYVRPQTLALFGYAPEQLIELANPLSAERPFLAPTLAINLAEVVEKNSHSRDEVAVFEIAKIFKLGELIPDVSKKEDRALPAQPTVLGIALSGKKATNNFARVRETVQSIFRECGYELSVRPMQSELAWSRVGHAAEFFCDGVVVGYIGSMNSAVRSGMGIEHETVIAEINLSELFAQEPKVHQYKKTGNFPHSIRDIAVVVSEQITAGELSATVLGAHQLVQSAEIFDIFRGEKIGVGKKAVALHVTYRADDHTLTGEEVEAGHRAVTVALQNKCGATIR